MSERDIAVRRSAFVMWFTAVLAVPFVIFGVDLLFQRRLANQIRDYIYPPDNVTGPPFETHQLAWAWVFLIVGTLFAGWALKELIAPRTILATTSKGLALSVGGPFSRSVSIPWAAIGDVTADFAEDDRGIHPVLRLRILERGELPEEPWGARWDTDGVLTMSAAQWDVSPEALVERIAELAILDATQSPSTSQPPAPADSHGPDLTDVEPPVVDGPWIRPETEIVVGMDETPDEP
jgi:hypothetical protein